MHFHFIGNGLSDILLQIQYVARVAFVTLRPKLLARRGLSQCAVIRTRSPTRNTEPSTTASTPSSFATWGRDFFESL